MVVFIIMVKNVSLNCEYCDSIWENKEDAKEHREWLTKELSQHRCEYNVTIETKLLYEHIEKK